MKNSSKEFYKKYKKRYEKNEKLRKGTKSRIPKKGIIAAAIIGGGLCALFLTLNFWGYKEDKTLKKDDMAEINTLLGLPVVAMESKNGTLFNKLTAKKSGDFAQMEEPSSITPLSGDKKQTIRIFLPREQINKVSYQIMDIGNGSLIETSEDVNISGNENFSQADLNIKDLLEPKQEYSLEIKVETKEVGTLIYDTKIVSKGEIQIDDRIAMINDFTDKLYKDSSADIEEYLIPTSNENDKNYTKANIYSPVEATTWKRFVPNNKCDNIPTIVKIDDNSATIVQSYPLILNDDGINRRIVTNDVYTITKGMNGEQYLTYYERKASETLTEASVNLTSVGFRLGFSPFKEAPITVSKNENYAVIVNGGNIWSVCNGTGTSEDGADISKVTRIFGFGSNFKGDTDVSSDISVTKDGEPDKISANYGYDIKNVENNGNITFAVYGMFPTGEHAGKSGIAIYRHAEKDKVLTQEVFISMDREKEELEDIAKNSYFSQDGYYYLKKDGIIKINTKTMETEKIVDNCENDSVYFSKSGNYYSYKEKTGSVKGPKNIFICNSATQEKCKVELDENATVDPLGFIGEDLVIGMKNDNSNLYYQFLIVDKDGKEKNVYEKENKKFGDIRVSDAMIEFNIYTNNNGIYEQESSDKIIDGSAASASSNVYTTVMEDPTIGDQLWVVFKKGVVKSEVCEPFIIKGYIYAKEKEINL